MMRLASRGFSSRKLASASPSTAETSPATSAFISFTFVWLSNCGSGCLMLTTSVTPSRVSSDEKFLSFSFRKLFLRA